MSPDEGIIQEFLVDNGIPKGWTDLTAGQIVSFNECYFRIVNVDITAQELTLKPLPKMEALTEILTAKMVKFEDHRHLC